MILLFVAVVSTLACFCFTALEWIGHERLRIIHNYYSYQRILCVPVWVGFVLRFKFLIDSCLSLKEKIIIEMSLQANEISGNRFTQAINFVPFFICINSRTMQVFLLLNFTFLLRVVICYFNVSLYVFNMSLVINFIQYFQISRKSPECVVT